MAAYYNDHDVFAAAWLRELIKEGLIADGEVDTRSVADVQPGDLDGFVQCHWFAGIVLKRGITTSDRVQGAQRATEGIEPESRPAAVHVEYPSATFWANVTWLPCRDGKARPVESLDVEVADGLPRELGYVCAAGADRAWLSPLSHRATNRVGRLRGYGNSIKAPLAAALIRAYMEEC